MSFKQVDVSAKPISFRQATAEGFIRLKPETVARIRKGGIEKGDPISLARLAGVLASKKTPEFVVLCHQLRIDSTAVEAALKGDGVWVRATVSARERTGVEMEALTAVSVALLNVWDVTKQYEKDASGQYPSTRIENIRVTKKVKKLAKAP
ncbi:MAG TPA: cyclic pyranopterin monophosphate synthase MoaC [Nitrososphaerales archaeon]|nr:cyclic pyranopterin monophosphate synthase MoaC [Nitrososphaerales archaeon]